MLPLTFLRSEMKELNDNFSDGGTLDGRFVVVVLVVLVVVVVVVVAGGFVVVFVFGLFEVGVLLVVVELFSGFSFSFSDESDFFRATGNRCGGPRFGGNGG